MKNLYFLLISFIIAAIPATSVVAQGTETFESPLPVNSTSWTNAGLTFSSSSANFDTDEFIGAGAGGSDRYIDNIDAPATGSIYSISITGGATLFTMQSMEVYVSSIATGDNPTDDGTMIFRGFNGVTEEFSYTKPMGTFPTDFTNNGFFLLDFSAIPGLGDVSDTNIDRIEMELTGAFQYFAVDNFAFDNEVLEADPPEVQSITVVGMPNSTATSVDFLVTFNENANMVTTDDFSVDATGGVTGSITGISGSGTMYTLTVSGISGEGTISIDLNGGTDIEDDLGNAGPPAFTAGEVHVVSRCFQETFESFTAGDIMWSSNGVTYSSGTANFNVELFANGGAGGSDQFLSNDADQGTMRVYTIAPTGAELFTVEAADFYLSSELNGANPTDDGTLTLEGRLGGSTLYTIQKTMGFPTDFSVNNGFYTVDFATEGSADYSLTNIDELRITIGGLFEYIAMDNFEHCEEITAAAPPIVQSISLVGNPPANSASVDFEVIFNEDAVNVTTDDFSLDLLGTAAGTINSISGSGNTYMVGINGISGEGSLRLDLNPGTDIEDLSGNTPPDPFTDGERFIVSICDVETFEGLPIGTFTWTTNTVPWTVGSTDFGVDEFIGAGAGGSDRYIDNVTSPGLLDVNSIAITDTQMVKMGSMEIYVSSDPVGANPTDDGTLTVVGKLDGVTQYTVVKSMGFPTIFGSTHGFYLWDFSTEGGVDNSMTDIDEIELTLGGSFQYLAVDNFKFCMDPPDETEVALAGGTLTITDINGGTSDDVFDLSVVGPNLRITNTIDRFLVSGAGVVEVDDNTVDVLLANITNGIVLNAAAGNDSYTQSSAITLAGASNDFTVQNIESFTQSAALDVGGSVTYGVSGAVTLNTTTAGGDLSIASVGNITDSGNTITVSGAASLNTGAAGNIDMSGPFNVSGMIDADALSVTIFNTPSVPWIINNISSSSGNINITSNSNGLTLTGTISANAGAGNATIRSGGLGGINQTGGAITANNLIINTGGQTATITQPGNDVNTLNVGTGSATFTDVDDVSITGTNPLNQLSVTATDIDFSNTATVTLSGAGANVFNGNITANPGSQLNQNSGDVSFTGTTINLNNLQYNGAGGTNTSFDATTTTAGSALTFFNLNVNSGDYQTNAVTTFVNGTAMFGSTANLIGTGTISGDVVIANGGELAPGNSPGCLSTGSLTLSSGSTATFEVTGPTPCTQHDQIQVTGTVTINGATFNPLIGYGNAPADEIILILNDGVDAVTGTFAGLPEGTAVNFGAFMGFISYVGGDGNDVILAADTTPPTVTCPSDITQGTDPGMCSAVVTFTVTATDDNPGVTLVVTPPSGSTFPVGTTLVTATATDAAGNMASCTFNVTVNDTEVPVVTCPTDITQANDPGMCGAVVTFMASATDNCPGVTTSSVPASGSFFPVGTTTVTVTATDAAGNTDTCMFDVTVNDTENPTISCPADIVVSNDPGVCGAVITFADATAMDNCAGVTVAQTGGPASGSTFPVGTTAVTFTATDAAGNTAMCSFNVTVNDTEDPVITCPADIIVSNDPGVCEAIVTYTAPVGTDNCPGATTMQTAGLPSGSSFPVGTTTNTFVVTDASGNTATCSFNVTVNDTEDPVVTCPADITQANDPGMCGAVVTFMASATDNCPGVTTSSVPASGSFFPVGTTTVTVTATDAAGNTATCSFDVTINDTEDPVISCPANISVNNDPGLCSAVVTYTAPVGTDNCAGATTAQTAGLPSGSAFPVGTTTNTFVVTDASGNTATCSFDVTVTDNEPPVAVCMDITVQLDANGMASITPFDVDGGSNDNCGIASLAVSPSAFDCSNVGTNTVTLTVTDTSGNSSSCTATVTVEDNVPPTAMCVPDFTLPLDATGNASIAPADIDNGSTDACGIASLSISPSTFTCADVGPNMVTLTVTDVNGNVSTCTTVVTVEDVTPPSIACPADVTTSNDPGICGATVFFADAIATDECGVMSVVQTMGPPSGSVFPVGTTTIEFTATDVNGNTNTCTFDITVTDDEPPVAVCMDITISLDASGNASITPMDVDGGSTDNCGIASMTVTPSTFTCADVGPNNVVLEVTDTSGNVSSCTAVVTVEDVTPPVAVCQDITVQLDVNGMATITGADVDGGSTDACGVASLSVSPDTFDCSNVGDNVVTLTVTDVNGNTSTCTAIVTVEDNIAPDLVCMDITLELDENGEAVITPDDVILSNTDACGIDTTAVDIFEFDCDDVGTPVTVTVFSIDVNGNISSCMAVVTVVDALPPVVTCPADQTVDPGPGNLFYTVPDYFATGEATAVDNCTDPLTITSQDPAAGTQLTDGVYTVTICATDDSGNEGCCTFELTVESILGGNDPADFGTLVLYPNPATDVIYLSNPKRMELEQVAIYDVTGRLVKTISLEGMGSEKALDISELASATYMFIINSEYGQMTKSIVKE